MNALSLALLLASSSLSSPAGGDAELIRICDTHAAKLDAANLLIEDDVNDPIQVAYDQSCEAISNTRAWTLDGIMAKARAAKAEAARFHPDGEECWLGGPAGTWAADVANELLLLGGWAPPTPSPDAELLAACGEYLRIQRAFEAYAATLPGDVEDGDPGLAMADPVDALVETIVAARATTAEGHLARARCAAFGWLPRAGVCQDDPDAANVDRFNAASLRDLVDMEHGADACTSVVTAARSDAELLKTCAAFDVLERAYVAAASGRELPGTPEDAAADVEQERITAEQGPLVERMCELRAVTQEGQAARARSLALWDAELMKEGRGDTGQCLTAAIVRDLLAGRSVA